MSKPFVHAESSVRRHGGVPDDYIQIHNFLDSSKAVVADGRHRMLTHNTWFLSVVLERVFGVTLTNSDGRVVSVRTIGEEHVLEDYGQRFIPTPQDYIEHMDHADWMLNGKGLPPSSARLARPRVKREVLWDREYNNSFPPDDDSNKLVD